MRILFVVPYVPSRVRIRPYEFIRALRRLGHHVHVVALRPPEDGWAPAAPVQAICAGVDIFPLARARTLLNAGVALVGPRPLQEAYSRHPGAQRHIRTLAATGGFDVLHVEHLRGATLAGAVAGIPVVFDAVDSIAHLFEQTARAASGWRQRMLARVDLARTRRFEAGAPYLFQRTLVTSPVDREAFVRLAGVAARDRVLVVPNGVDCQYFERADAARDPATILFSGKMSYHANAAAALHLARHIMPEVWRARPDARLVVAGKDPSDEVRALAADRRVEVTGYLDDLRPVMWRATVAVAPMPYGAGIQNKILEAMAAGVPVVASPVAAGGLAAEPGADLLVGSTASEIASHILRLLDDSMLCDRLRSAGRGFVRRHHDWTALGRRLIEVYEAAREDHGAQGQTAAGSLPAAGPRAGH